MTNNTPWIKRPAPYSEILGDGTARLQVGGYRRDSIFKGWAIIDEDDLEDFALYRWSWSGHYAYRVLSKKRIYLHREIMGLSVGDGAVVDHINRNTLDNRRINLRLGTTKLNIQNRGSYTDSTSQYRGVCWDKSREKWTATCRVNNVQHNLGRFDDEIEAARVALGFRLEHLPFAID